MCNLIINFRTRYIFEDGESYEKLILANKEVPFIN